MNKDFRIKNYKTSISWQKTVREIEELLVAIGASAILKNYRGDGRIEALTFSFQSRGYMLPANSERLAELLKGYPGLRAKRHNVSDAFCTALVAYYSKKKVD